MSDPLTLAAIAGAGVGPTFTFLYSCLQDILSRRRRPETVEQPTTIEVPPELEAPGTELIADAAVVDSHLDELRRIKGSLSDFVDDPRLVDQADTELVAELGLLRGILSEIYGQELTLQAAQSSGQPVTRVRTVMTDVRGEHTGLRARNVYTGLDVSTEVTGGDAASRTIGADVLGDVGAPPRPANP